MPKILRSASALALACFIAALALAFVLAAPAALAFVLTAPAALAADTSVAVPWGDWVTAVLGGSREAIAAVVPLIYAALMAVVARSVGGPVALLLRGVVTERTIQRAIDYGINAVEGAAHGEVLTVPLGNAVIAHAADYCVQALPQWLTQWLGGPDAIARMILARLKLTPDASVDLMVVRPPPVTSVPNAPMDIRPAGNHR